MCITDEAVVANLVHVIRELVRLGTAMPIERQVGRHSRTTAICALARVERMHSRNREGEPRRPDAVGPGSRPRVDPAAFAQAVLLVTEAIPAGRVLSYGDIAELLGCGGPRQVGRALSHSTRHVPWWRVLPAGGAPAGGLAPRARPHYDDECTALTVPADPTGPHEYRVDMIRARWWPTDAEQMQLADLGAALRRGTP